MEDLLGELTKSHATDLMETCVLAWGQVGRYGSIGMPMIKYSLVTNED